MKLGEFFINLGVKGAEAADKAIIGVRDNLASVGETGLAAKAAIIGVVYGLQRLTGMAGAQGAELKQFSEATGLSADRLQRWQYAARQYNTAGSEVLNTTKSIQTAMTNMLTNGTAPEKMGLLANAVGFDFKKANDTFYVMDKLQEFAQSKVPDALKRQVLSSFGLSDSMVAFMKQNKVNLDTISAARIYSMGQVNALAKVDTAWANIGDRFSKFSGKYVARFGLQGIDTLDKAFTAVERMVRSIDKLMTKLPELQAVGVATGIALGAAFAPWTLAITGLIWLLAKIEESKYFTAGKDGKSQFDKEMEGMGKSITAIAKGDKSLRSVFELGASDMSKWAGTPAAYNPDPSARMQPAPVINSTVNQTNNIHGVKDAKDVGRETGRSTRQAQNALQQSLTQRVIK